MDKDMDLFRRAIEAGAGWYAIAAAAVVLFIRMLRSETVQLLLPLPWQWKRLRRWVRLGIVFLTALASAWVTTLLAGHPPLAALGMAIPIAVAAIAGHKTTQAIGYAHTNASINGNLAYEPGSIRTAISPILPIDRRAVKRANEIANIPSK